MDHPDDGLIQALLDREMEGGEARGLQAHLEACPQCKGVAETLEAASAATARSLLLIDVEPRTQEVKKGIRARQEPRSGRGPRWYGMSLPRAASIALLLTAGAASALPGSPVRRWVVQGWDAFTGAFQAGREGDQPRGSAEEPAVTPPEESPPETGAGIPVLAGGIEILVHDLPTDAELRVLWTDGEEAWIFAGEGTRFNRDGERLEAFSPPGPVRIEIPRNIGHLTLSLDGAVLLRKNGQELEILAPVQEQTPSEIRFGAGGSDTRTRTDPGSPGPGTPNDGMPVSVSNP